MLARQAVYSLLLLHGKTERLAERRTEVSKKVSDILPKTEIQKAWEVRGGKTLKVTFELFTDKEQSHE